MDVIIDDSQLMDELESRIDQILHSELPLSKIKKICKLDPDELFIAEFAKACYTQAANERRKTVQRKDIDRVIKTNWMFEFLEDALDGWPDYTIRTKQNADDSQLGGEDNENDLTETDILEESAIESAADQTAETEDDIELETAEESMSDEIDEVQETPDIFE